MDLLSLCAWRCDSRKVSDYNDADLTSFATQLRGGLSVGIQATTFFLSSNFVLPWRVRRGVLCCLRKPVRCVRMVLRSSWTVSQHLCKHARRAQHNMFQLSKSTEAKTLQKFWMRSNASDLVVNMFMDELLKVNTHRGEP